MSEVESCRLCCSTVIVSQHNFRMVFSTECLKVDFAGRLSRLLDLPVLQSDGLSEYLCRSCLRKVDSLEAFKCLTRQSYQKQRLNKQIHSSPVSRAGKKRPKDTSGNEASPHTVQSRPLAKRSTVGTAGKRLVFAPIQSRHSINTYMHVHYT